ncbi:MAG: transposase [Ferruginibacter sp.]
MKQSYPEYWPQYFTATIYEWRHLLSDNSCKNIIIDSLRFLVINKRIELNAFVIMSNHFHAIWQPLFGFTPPGIQASFMKYTAQQLKQTLERNNPKLLESFVVNKEDRTYQIWKRRPLSIELRSEGVFDQKLDYIHYNPVKAGLCIQPEDYYYSSAEFYHNGNDNFGIVTHYSGN